MTRELSPAEASEYDFYLLVDCSGSMGSESHRFPGSTLWNEAEEFTLGLAHFAANVDDDGITVITFGGKVEKFDGVTAQKVHEVFQTVQPGGRTPLLGALQAAMDKYESAGKKAIVLIITDGAPDPGTENDIAQLIIKAGNGLKDEHDLSFGFIQLGRDRAAAAFLDFLDDDLEKKGAKYDIVDAVKAEVAEALSIPQLLAKVQDD